MKIKKKRKLKKLVIRQDRHYSKFRLLTSSIAIFLLINVFLGLSFGSVARADSNDRISAYISMAAGKKIVSEDIDKLRLSKKDMQFLGVYISNYFIPFGTELGASSDEGVTKSKENIKKALQTNLNFADSLADALTENILGLSRSSVQELSLCVSKEYQKGIIPLQGVPLNYYSMLTCMTGGLKSAMVFFDDSITLYKDIAKGTYQYGYLAYQKDGKWIPVFDFAMDVGKATPSQVAFLRALSSQNLKMGYGFCYLDFTDKEMGSSESDYKDKIDKITYKMTALGTKIDVDCFGNIILMGSNHQYIAIPACMNPYTWISVDKEGVDTSDYGGDKFNIANIPSLSMLESSKDRLFDSTSKDGDSIKGIVNMSGVCDSLKEVSDGSNIYKLRRTRGSDECDLETTWSFFGKTEFQKLYNKTRDEFLKEYEDSKNIIPLSSQGNASDYINIYGLNYNSAYFPKVDILDGFVFTDNLGAAHFDESGEDDYSAFKVSRYIDNSEDFTKLKEDMKKWGDSEDNGFSNMYKSIEDGALVVPSAISKESMVGLYVTYAFSSLYDDSSSEAKKSTIGDLGFRMNNKTLPAIPDESLELPQEAVADVMLTSIRDWTYYLLHPTEGIDYFRVWLKNKVNGFLVGWHNDMVGTNGTGSINGTTYYRGTSGYVTSPDLSDVPWANSLINYYNKAIPFIIIVFVIFMIGAFVTGTLSLQRAIAGLLLFIATSLLPCPIINGVVGTSNRFASSLYGEKFTYWALVQHESYSDAIDEAASGNDYSNYLKTLYSTNAQATGNQGSESVMLKWQAPKKMSSLMLTKEDQNKVSGFSSALLSGLLQSTYSGENFTDNEDSVYLYRSYIDIANFSRYIHRGLTASPTKQPINLSLTNDITRTWNPSLREAIQNYDTVYTKDRNLGYANKNGDGSYDGTKKNILRVRLPLSSGIVSEAYGVDKDLKDLKIDEYVGINQDAFKFSIPMFNVGSKDFISELGTDNFKADRYTPEDFSGLAAYGLMSENPFYYFSWYLYETGLSTASGATNGYKNLLLKEDNNGFFYNTTGNGEMKDFMDMRSLFTYIIPYLKQGNDIVKDWDKTYGIFIYEDVPIEEGHQNDSSIKDNPEMKQKYWHNLNVARLYNIYTPWVDVMYDCSYAKPEKIRVFGETKVIEDPINPASYPSNRPMIFSRSEMVDYGLTEEQLTTVERKILECDDGMQERLFNLLNYYTFNDTVLNTAAAMNCAFEFNTVFSENGLIGANHNIYPQAYELSDFSYDAYLRFILSCSTGDSMLIDNNTNFYDNLTNNSSITTVIVMLILDIISVYLIPALKIFFIVGMFIMCIVLILMTAFRVDPRFKFVNKLGKNFILPMFKFLGINCGFAYIISLFMGNGSSSVTGVSSATISLGDPVMVMLAMIILNCVVVFMLFKMLKSVWNEVKSTSKMLGNFLAGVAGGVGSMVLAGTKVAVAGTKVAGGVGRKSLGLSKSAISSIGRVASKANTTTSQSHTIYNSDGTSYESSSNKRTTNWRLKRKAKKTEKFKENPTKSESDNKSNENPTKRNKSKSDSKLNATNNIIKKGLNKISGKFKGGK